MRNASRCGHGMCQKWLMIASGRRVLQNSREQGEVVVLDQHDGGRPFDLLEDGFGEPSR